MESVVPAWAAGDVNLLFAHGEGTDGGADRCADVRPSGLRRGRLVAFLGVFGALREWDDVAAPHLRGGAVRRHVPRRVECDV